MGGGSRLAPHLHHTDGIRRRFKEHFQSSIRRFAVRSQQPEFLPKRAGEAGRRRRSAPIPNQRICLQRPAAFPGRGERARGF
jgi:hypothetical protein